MSKQKDEFEATLDHLVEHLGSQPVVDPEPPVRPQALPEAKVVPKPSARAPTRVWLWLGIIVLGAIAAGGIGAGAVYLYQSSLAGEPVEEGRAPATRVPVVAQPGPVVEPLPVPAPVTREEKSRAARMEQGVSAGPKSEQRPEAKTAIRPRANRRDAAKRRRASRRAARAAAKDKKVVKEAPTPAVSGPSEWEDPYQ